MNFADVMLARQAQQDRMTEVIDGLADDDAANIALLAREGEPDPSEFLRSLPPEARAKAEAGADAAIRKAQETSKARGSLKKRAQGGGLVGRVDTPKSKPPARRQDQSIDPDLSGDQPLGRSLFSFGRAANQIGAGRMGLISTHLDIGAANYNPILQSTSQDVAALVQELKKPYQTYEDFFNADIKEMQEIKNALAENNYTETIAFHARQQDLAIKRANVTPLASTSDASIREALEHNGVSVPDGVALNSAEGYDILMDTARKLSKDGDEGTANNVFHLANPLSDQDGFTLGSRVIDDYMQPVAVIETAERLGVGRYLKGSGFPDLESLIQAEPQLFSRAVDDLQDFLSEFTASGLDYGARRDQRSVFYQSVEKEAIETEGYVNLDMTTRSGRFLRELDISDDSVLSEGHLQWLASPKNVNADEDAFLGISKFIDLMRQEGRPVTAGSLRHLTESMKPKVQVVNLGQTGRQEFAAYSSGAGNMSDYTELLIRLPEPSNDRFYRHIQAEHFGDNFSGHFYRDVSLSDTRLSDRFDLSQTGPSEYGDPRPFTPTVSTKRPATDNILMHLRLNSYVNPDGKKLLLVQELQSDMLQLERRARTSTKNLNRLGIDDDFISRLIVPANSVQKYAKINAAVRQAKNHGLTDLKLSKIDWSKATKSGREEQAIKDYIRDNLNVLMARQYRLSEIGSAGMPDTPFAPHRDTWKTYGMKVAAHTASEQGYDGIAILNGADIARAVNGDPRVIASHHDKMTKGILAHFRKSREQGGLGAAEGFESQAGHAFPEKVTPDNLKLNLHQRGGQDSGVDEVYLAGIIESRSVGASTSDAAVGRKVWISKESGNWEGSEGYSVFVEEEFVGFHDTIRGAKEEAATLMNDDHDALLKFRDDTAAVDNTYETTELLFDETTKANAVDNVFFQGQKTNGGAKASIIFPVKDPTGARAGDIDLPEQWMKSQYKTLIVAYKQADPYSFVHEMGHLMRMSLRQIKPEYLDRVEKTLGVKGGNWTQQITDPLTKELRPAEEVFADAFMQWVKEGGKRQDEGLGGMLNKFKDFIVSTYRGFARGSDVERQLSPEMHQFFDDIVGEQKYTSIKNRTLMDALDGLKYTSARALNAMQEEIGPEELMQAERMVLHSRIEKARNVKVSDLKSQGMDGAEGMVATIDDALDDLVKDMESIHASGKKIPAKMTAGKSGYKVSTKVDIKEKLAQFRMDEDVLSDVTRIYQLSNDLSKDNAFKNMGDWYDAYTNMFKSNVTTVWPAFHFRNLMSGAFQNALNDVFDPTETLLKKYLKPHHDAAKIMVGDSTDGLDFIPAFKGMSDEEASEGLRKLAFRYGVFDSPGQHREIYGVGGSVQDMIPGSQKMEGNTLREKMWSFMKQKSANPEAHLPGSQKGSRLDSWKPWKVAGATGTLDHFAPARWGRPAGDLIEGSHRLGGFIAMLKQGYDPAEAAKRVRLLQVDYSDLSSAERVVLRRLFPFYSFAKGMSKYLANEIYTRPGGKVANTMRSANRVRDDKVTTPEYISQGVSIPLSPDKDGSLNFITGLGLMHESVLPMGDAVSNFLFSGDVQKPLYEVGGMLNPAPKAVIENMLNRSLFQEDPRGGRLLDDMDPPLGRIGSNIAKGLGIRDSDEAMKTPKLLESLVSNSPMSKYVSTLKQVTDTRKNLFPTKALNTLTGVKISKVSPQAQDQILRERSSILMNSLGGRTFERDYIPEDVLQSLSPEDRAVADKLRSSSALLSDRAKQRKAIKEMQKAQENN